MRATEQVKTTLPRIEQEQEEDKDARPLGNCQADSKDEQTKEQKKSEGKEDDRKYELVDHLKYELTKDEDKEDEEAKPKVEQGMQQGFKDEVGAKLKDEVKTGEMTGTEFKIQVKRLKKVVKPRVKITKE